MAAVLRQRQRNKEPTATTIDRPKRRLMSTRQPTESRINFDSALGGKLELLWLCAEIVSKQPLAFILSCLLF